MIGQYRQCGAALLITQHVHVIQDERHGPGHQREGRAEPGHDRAEHRGSPGVERVEDPPADGLHRIERLGHVGQQDLRVVVRLLDRHPGESLATARSPLRQQRCLPVAGRRGDRDEPTSIAVGQAFEQNRTPDGSRPHQRMQQLRRDEIKCLADPAVCPLGPRPRVCVVHGPTMPLGTVCRFILCRNNKPGQARHPVPAGQIGRTRCLLIGRSSQ